MRVFGLCSVDVVRNGASTVKIAFGDTKDVTVSGSTSKKENRPHLNSSLSYVSFV